MEFSASDSSFAITPSEERPHRPETSGAGVFGSSTCAYITAEARAKWTYFLLGCAILLPWNVVANGSSFILSRLAGSPFALTFGSYFATVYTLSKLVFQLYCTATSKQRSSPSRHIIGSIVAMIILVMSLWLSTFVRGTPSTFFPFVLFISGSLGAAVACLCAAVYAKAAAHGLWFLQAVLSGQAAIAVMTGVVNVASSLISLSSLSPRYISMYMTEMRASGGDDQAEEIAARIFFGIFALFFFITLLAYVQLTEDASHGSVPHTQEGHSEARERTRLLSNDPRNSPMQTDLHIYQILKENSSFMFSIAYSYVVTLAVFPAVTIRVQPVNPRTHPMLFTAVHMLVFNVADLLGRLNWTSAHLSFWTAKKILVVSVLRTLFVPMILVCNINRPAMTSSVWLIGRSDVYFMLVVWALGYTQGAVLTLGTLGVSSLEHNPKLEGRCENAQVAGMLSSTLGVVGLAAGSLSSFGVQAMI